MMDILITILIGAVKLIGGIICASITGIFLGGPIDDMPEVFPFILIIVAVFGAGAYFPLTSLLGTAGWMLGIIVAIIVLLIVKCVEPTWESKRSKRKKEEERYFLMKYRD